VLIGGNGARRTLRLAARHAVEWNAMFRAPEHWSELNRRLNGYLHEAGRAPAEVRRSMMTGVVFGRRPADVDAALRARGRTRDELRARGVIVGTPEEIPEQLAALQAAGLDEVMLQWLELDDLDGLALLGGTVIGRS
jgi:alkanesulfonate monooxygenase SsuD/methylene tetrahydromethanopterin reductase-like flavin-dependent oxidoreductase (luciferase family)